MGDPPTAQEGSTKSGEPDQERRLGEVLAAYFAAVEDGQSPTAQELIAQHPGLALELEAFFADHERFGRLVAPLRPVAQAAPADAATLAGAESTAASQLEGPQPAATLSLDEEAGPTPDRDAAAVDQPVGPEANASDRDADVELPRGTRVRYFGDYVLQTVLGEGGMGVVYRAKQVSLNRLVAVKMIRAGLWAGEDEVRRFKNEAEAVAGLDHPQIVPIYEIGSHDGQHYFSMKLVGEAGLATKLPRYAADPRAAARLVAEIARAVHHAHQRGILHRDLKPSNILLDAEGHPSVTDFGLAKKLGRNGELSVSGSILGTPAYMSPEQASGRRGSVTTATDVYGLGAILYTALTGRPPFQADDVLETLEQVRGRIPERPSVLNARVDRDLETICLKCLEKDPKRRYDSASALADDLVRYLRGEPILARRTGAWERLRKWSRRHPAAAALVGTSAIAALTIAGLGVSLFIHSQLRSAYAEVIRQRGIAEEHRGIAEAALASERTFLYQNRIMFADRELNDNSPHNAEELLDECPPDRREWEWNYLKRQCQTALKTIPCEPGLVRPVVISPDGRLIATGTFFSGTVKVWDSQSGELSTTLSGHQVGEDSAVWCAFAPEGKRIASVGGSRYRPNHLLVHEVATGKELLRVRLPTGQGASPAFSPDDGTQIVVSSGEVRGMAALGKHAGWLKAYDAVTGKERCNFPTDGQNALAPSFSRDGKSVIAVLGHWDADDQSGTLNEVRVWNATTGAKRLTIRNENTRDLISACFSPDDRTIATCGYDSTLRLWDAVDGHELAVFRGHRACTNFAAFSPDGRRIASTSDDGSARIWDLQTGETLITLRGHRGNFDSVAFSSDGQRLVTSSTDGTVKIWNANTDPRARSITVSDRHVWALAFSPDSHRLVTGGHDGVLKLWEVPSGRLVKAWTGHTQPVWDVAFSPDGSRIASGAGDWTNADQLGEVHIWDATTGTVLHPLRAHKAIARCIRFSSDGRTLISAGGETYTPGQEIIFWDVATGKRQRTIPNLEGGASALARSRDGRRIAGHFAFGLRTWDVETGQSLTSLERPTSSTGSLAYSGDGRTLFATSSFGFVDVWDVATGQSRKTLRADKFWTMSLAVSPAGTRMVTTGSDNTLKLWDTMTYQHLITLHGHATRSIGIRGVAFSPDGGWIASSDSLGVVKLWDGSPFTGGAR
jgi:WD40 repeat protein